MNKGLFLCGLFIALFNICREEFGWREDRSLASCATGGVAMALSSCKL